MRNFETIVRPVILPNIRPSQTRPSSPESDPEKGLARINGQSGKIVSFPYNWSYNLSRTKQQEIKRKVDEVRVYQKDDNGTINRENFVDVEVTKKLWISEPGPRGPDMSGPGYGTPGVGSGPPGVTNHKWPIYFAPVEEKDNIEIRERAVIKENPNYVGEK